MTADIATQTKETGPSSLLHTLTLALAALTLCFALFSMILGSRMASLHANTLKAEKETVASESASLMEMENALKTATEKLETTQKNLVEEKEAAEKLRRQLAAAMKDLEKIKTDLAGANQTITRLQSSVPTQPPPGVSITGGTTAAPISAPQAVNPSMSPPAPGQTPAAIPVTNSPEVSAPQAPAVKSEASADSAPPPAAAPLPAVSTSPVTEEAISDTVRTAPTNAPAAD